MSQSGNVNQQFIITIIHKYISQQNNRTKLILIKQHRTLLTLFQYINIMFRQITKNHKTAIITAIFYCSQSPHCEPFSRIFIQNFPILASIHSVHWRSQAYLKTLKIGIIKTLVWDKKKQQPHFYELSHKNQYCTSSWFFCIEEFLISISLKSNEIERKNSILALKIFFRISDLWP